MELPIQHVLRSIYELGLLNGCVATGPLYADEWRAMLKTISSIDYGDFNGAVLASWLQANAPSIAWVRFGRELSPVAYVEFDSELAGRGQRHMEQISGFLEGKGMKPDEISLYDESTIRMWWD